MTAVLFNGNLFAKEIEKKLKERILSLPSQPQIVSIYFKEDKHSLVYTRLKQATADRIGIQFTAIDRSFLEPFHELQRFIREESHDQRIQGFVIQKPSRQVFADALSKPAIRSGNWLKDLSELVGTLSDENAAYDPWWRKLTFEIDPARDVDCLTNVNLDRVYRGKWTLVPATVRAVLNIIDRAKIFLKGKEAVVIGRSELVGKPLAHVLAQRGFHVKLCGSTGVAMVSEGKQFSGTHGLEELPEAVYGADLVISATGQFHLISGEMVKNGAVVIDVGEPFADVDFEQVCEKASFITPVPGGVGPVTVVSLFENLLDTL